MVVSRDLEYGLGRMYEITREREGLTFRVVRDYDAALAWLRGGPDPAP